MDLTYQIIAAAIEVHKHLGPGLLESAYSFCLASELQSRGIEFKREIIVPIVYKNTRLDCGFRTDFIVQDQVILEVKSIEAFLPVHESQLLTYLRLMNKEIGLLINFNVTVLKKGIRRCVLKAHEHAI